MEASRERHCPTFYGRFGRAAVARGPRGIGIMIDFTRHWISRFMAKKSAPSWRAELDNALRDARPSAPELNDRQAAAMLAAAIAQSRRPRRSSSGPIAMITACAALVILAAVMRGVSPRLTGSSAKQSAMVGSYVRVEKRPLLTARDSPAVLPGIRGKFSRLRGPKTRRRTWASHMSRVHPRKWSERLAANAPLKLLSVPVNYGPAYVPSLPHAPEEEPVVNNSTGRLVVIMDGPLPPKLNVIVTSDEPGNSGYARVASYTPIGPGGGVLTQTTVHGVESEEGASTSRYGIVFGKPAARLLNDCSQTGATPASTEKERDDEAHDE